MTAVYKDEEADWLTVCLKYLLFVFNFLFWVGGVAVLGVGVWTLVEKSDYLSLLASSTFAVSAYILILAGSMVVVTGFLGCCAVIREQKSCLSMYFFCLLVIFLIELVAGVLAYVYYQRLSEELNQHLNQTMTDNYAQPGREAITLAVDRLQQDFKCCGSNNSRDWMVSVYVSSKQAEDRLVPDSCCKTITPHCGNRDHPSNIYKVEGNFCVAMQWESPTQEEDTVEQELRCQTLEVYLELRPEDSHHKSQQSRSDCTGRLHHEAGAVSGQSPAGHRRCGNRSGLSAAGRGSVDRLLYLSAV
ncbi:tetraspanin-11 isoform X2 [Pseudochaenichthys georgianus]|uniref:tetraspanin-11 isoform X2 n=1 Tax=Pseudochaenichthys georgianus TaxID=52239 RepID=UPI0039C1E1F3